MFLYSVQWWRCTRVSGWPWRSCRPSSPSSWSATPSTRSSCCSSWRHWRATTPRKVILHLFTMRYHMNAAFCVPIYAVIQLPVSCLCEKTHTFNILQWTRQFRVIDSSGSPSHKHCPFSRMSKYIDLLIILSFPKSSLLAAWNLLLAVKFWFTDVVITKRLTTPIPWKVKIPVKCLHPTS